MATLWRNFGNKWKASGKRIVICVMVSGFCVDRLRWLARLAYSGILHGDNAGGLRTAIPRPNEPTMINPRDTDPLAACDVDGAFSEQVIDLASLGEFNALIVRHSYLPSLCIHKPTTSRKASVKL